MPMFVRLILLSGLIMMKCTSGNSVTSVLTVSVEVSLSTKCEIISKLKANYIATSFSKYLVEASNISNGTLTAEPYCLVGNLHGDRRRILQSEMSTNNANVIGIRARFETREKSDQEKLKETLTVSSMKVSETVESIILTELVGVNVTGDIQVTIVGPQPIRSQDPPLENTNQKLFITALPAIGVGIFLAILMVVLYMKKPKNAIQPTYEPTPARIIEVGV